MYGAIIGDLAGSIYEYNQTKEIKPIQIKNIIEDNSFYSDDTILTIAVLDAILNDNNYEKYLKEYILSYSNKLPNHKPYFKNMFSPGSILWAKDLKEGNSRGNGAMMRISAVGWLSENEKEVIKHSKLATIPSHNTEEAISAATLTALIIYYFKKGFTKKELLKKLKLDIKYEPFTKFNTTCNETIGNCLYALYISNSFEEAIRNTILMGGDTDTNACIVGSMAEALYGINDELKRQALEKIPNDFQKILKKSDKFYR